VAGLFELDGVEVAQRGVAALAVVEHLDPFKRRAGQLGAGVPGGAAVDQFGLRRRNDSATALSSASPTVPIEPSRPAWRRRCPNAQDVYCLGAVVGMIHDTGGGSASPQRGLQGVDDEFGAQVVGDGVAHDQPRPRIDHHRDIDPALPGGMLGDVGHPQLVRTIRIELRSTRSSDDTAAGARRVQPWRRRRVIPTTPAARMSRSTRLRPTRIPIPNANSAWTRGDP